MTALRRLLAEELPPDDDLADMIADILSADLDDPDDIPDAEMLSELNEALNQARLDAAGGDIEARKTLKNIRAMIDEAAAQRRHPSSHADDARTIVRGRSDRNRRARARGVGPGAGLGSSQGLRGGRL